MFLQENDAFLHRPRVRGLLQMMTSVVSDEALVRTQDLGQG